MYEDGSKECGVDKGRLQIDTVAELAVESAVQSEPQKAQRGKRRTNKHNSKSAHKQPKINSKSAAGSKILAKQLLDIAAHCQCYGLTKASYIVQGSATVVADIHALQGVFRDLCSLQQLHLLVPAHLLSFTPSLLQLFMQLMGKIDIKTWRSRETVLGVFHQIYGMMDSESEELKSEKHTLCHGQFKMFVGSILESNA